MSGRGVEKSRIIKGGTRIHLRPLRADGDNGCRKFRLTAHGAFGLSEGRTVACPAEDGVWDLAPEIRLSRR